MIGHLKGIVLEKLPPQLLLDVQGVGYEVEASMNTFYRLPAVGSEASLFTHLVVREDAQLLFGFTDRQERTLFRELIKTNGVGPKLALTLLSGISADALISCIQREDTTTLVKVPGVGKKTAERLIIEMKDKLKQLHMPLLSGDPAEMPMHLQQTRADLRGEAESALLALGYKPVQATRAVEQASKQTGEGASTEELIKLALKSMVSA